MEESGNQRKISIHTRELLVNELILGHLNINSIPNKFEVLKFMIDNNIDIFLISETKLDDSFPSAQFLIKGFSALYRFDRNSKGVGLLFYIREDIPSKIQRTVLIVILKLI